MTSSARWARTNLPISSASSSSRSRILSIPRRRQRTKTSCAPGFRSTQTRHSTPPERVETVYVLSRVTLGADIKITSVILDAMKQRFPGAAIVLVANRKSL